MRPFSLFALFAALALAGSASGQVITLSFTGSGTGGNNSITGTGTGTLSPGGAAVVSLTGTSSNNDNCSNIVQLSLKLIVDASDSLTVQFNAPSPNGDATNFSLNGALTVTAGTGSYSGKGGSGTGTVAVQQGTKSGNSKPFTYTFNGSVSLAGPLVPVASLNPSGIVPVFTDIPILQPGSWVSVYGANLANATAQWNGDFPTSLGGVTVTIDGKAAYFWFVSAGQINLQAPDDSRSGCVPVVLNTPNGTINTSVELESISPSLSLLDSQYVAAVILTPNGSGAYGGGTYDLAGPVGHFSYPTRPAKKGESVVLYGVGFGPTNPTVPAGKLFGSSAATTNPVNIYLGTNQGNNFVSAPVAFSGLVGAGLYQVNITIPTNAPSGDLIVQATVGGNGTSGNNGVQTSGDFSVLLSVQ